MLDLKKYRANFQRENEAGNKTGNERGNETRNEAGGETGKMNKLCRGSKKLKMKCKNERQRTKEKVKVKNVLEGFRISLPSGVLPSHRLRDGS
ncbi:TPA: hypothetical protein HA338_00320 [Methanosarcina acetivorans]|uniref:Uncharacterized protein n=1 Tax=Methanosarcina acetivorans TaxID=2214 RepID=A0A832W5U7_9EURY|nr:hypothetical protein [Methanosarcina acetivorans]HIH92539.1 hypothetical protein [Methanosarcina acetivorans]